MNKEQYLEFVKTYTQFEDAFISRANRKYSVKHNGAQIIINNCDHVDILIYENETKITGTDYHWGGDSESYSSSLSIEEIIMNDSEFDEHLESIRAEIEREKKIKFDLDAQARLDREKKAYEELKKKFENG